MTAVCTRLFLPLPQSLMDSRVCPWGHCLHPQIFNDFYISLTLFAFTAFSELCPRCVIFVFVGFPELPVIFWGSAFNVLSNVGVGIAQSK